jgi:hypothetical protein
VSQSRYAAVTPSTTRKSYYDARVAAKNRGVEPLSVHKLIHLMIKQNKITASAAFGFADALNKAGRALDYSQA